MNNEFKELNRQCKMAWERGNQLGKIQGFIIFLLAFTLIVLIYNLILTII